MSPHPAPYRVTLNTSTNRTDEVPLIVTMIIMACGICGLVVLKYLYKLENRRRQMQLATWDEARYAAELTSTKRRGDQRRTFMYGT